MERPDQHDDIELNMVYTGSITYLIGGRKVRMDAGQVYVFWAGRPHQIVEFAHGSAYFVARAPLSWFLRCELPEKFRQALMHGNVLTDADTPRAGFDMALFAHWEKDLGARDAELLGIVQLELEARLRRLATHIALKPARTKRPPAVSVPVAALTKGEQMACLVAQRYTEQLSIPEISKAVELHPHYAMSVFKREFGTTLIDYLTNHRVSHARRLLATTNGKIEEIAAASGFNTLSRFNQAFRRVCHCTPRDYRTQTLKKS